MIDHSAAIARLSNIVVNGVRVFPQTGGAAKAAQLLNSASPIGDGPAAFVLPMDDRYEPPRSNAQPIQRVLSVFGVAIMVRSAGDAAGDQTLIKLEAANKALITAMVGWKPGPDFLPLWGDHGSLLDMSPGTMWWLQTFVTAYGNAPDPLTLAGQ